MPPQAAITLNGKPTQFEAKADGVSSFSQAINSSAPTHQTPDAAIAARPGLPLRGVETVVLRLNQYQQNWILYRSACEALKHEKYTYLGKASPYTNAADPHALLAERIEPLVS